MVKVQFLLERRLDVLRHAETMTFTLVDLQLDLISIFFDDLGD